MSFSLEENSLAGFIGTSFKILSDEFPAAYFLMSASLNPRRVLLHIDGETVALAFDLRGAQIAASSSAPEVEIDSTKQTILDVIDARLTLNDAVWNDAIRVKGKVEDVAICHEALLTYVRGAVRCPSFPLLLEQFRRYGL